MAAKQMRQWGDEADADKREKEGLPPEEYLPEVETIRQLREGFPMLGWYTRQAAPYLHARMTAAEPGSRLDMGRLATNELRTLIALLVKTIALKELANRERSKTAAEALTEAQYPRSDCRKLLCSCAL